MHKHPASPKSVRVLVENGSLRHDFSMDARGDSRELRSPVAHTCEPKSKTEETKVSIICTAKFTDLWRLFLKIKEALPEEIAAFALVIILRRDQDPLL
jgi:hypothetical protein